MPHMMPMLWMFMLLSTTMILFLIISLIYFMYLPLNKSFFNNKSIPQWNWKW